MTEGEAIRHLARTTVLSAAGAKEALGYLKNLPAPWEVKAEIVAKLATAASHSGVPGLLATALQRVKDQIGGAA